MGIIEQIQTNKINALKAKKLDELEQSKVIQDIINKARDLGLREGMEHATNKLLDTYPSNQEIGLVYKANTIKGL